MTFRKLLEGTNGTITVLVNGEYKTSFLQYDAYIESAGKILLKKFNSIKTASKIVRGSGELKGLSPLKFYTDRIKLMVSKNEREAVNNANEFHIKYFFDGTDWYYSKEKIKNFSDMDKLESLV